MRLRQNSSASTLAYCTFHVWWMHDLREFVRATSSYNIFGDDRNNANRLMFKVRRWPDNMQGKLYPVVMFGYIWLYLVMFGYICLVIFGYVWILGSHSILKFLLDLCYRVSWDHILHTEFGLPLIVPRTHSRYIFFSRINQFEKRFSLPPWSSSCLVSKHFKESLANRELPSRDLFSTDIGNYG